MSIQRINTEGRFNPSSTGLKPGEFVDVYMDNTGQCPDDQPLDTGEREHRSSLQGMGVKVRQARVTANGPGEGVVGCRVTVPSQQMDEDLETRGEVLCRKPRDQWGLRVCSREGYRAEPPHQQPCEKQYRDEHIGYCDNCNMCDDIDEHGG